MDWVLRREVLTTEFGYGLPVPGMDWVLTGTQEFGYGPRVPELGTEVRTEFGYGLRVPELGTEVLTEFGYRLRVPELVRLALRLLYALGRVGRRPRPGLQPDHLHRLLDLVQLAHVQRQRLQQQGNW